MKRFLLLLTVSAALSLGGCGTGDDSGTAILPDGPLTPLPAALVAGDPDDEALKTAIAGFIGADRGPAFTRYDYTRIDLDHDGRRDALVMMKGPHTYWCAASGCSMVVFKAGNDSFSVVTQILPVRGPILVADTETNGWRDLVIDVRGQSWEPAKQVVLQYDGATYPNNPLNEPPLSVAYRRDQGVRIFP